MAGRGVTIDFNANVARFTSGIDKATNDLARFQSNTDRTSKNINKVLANIGVGISAAGIVAFSKNVIDGLDKLNGLSKTTGIAAGQLAGLGYAAKQTGSDLDLAAAAVSKLSVNIGKDSEKYRALGITAKEPMEAFKQLADIFVSIKDPQQRAAVSAAALGKSWQDVAPLLSEGGAAIGRMVDEGEKASGVTQEMTEQANKFNGQLDAMRAKIAGVAVTLTGEFLPAMNSVLDKLKAASQSGGILSFFTASNEEEANAAATVTKLKDKVASLRKLREELTAPTLANKWNNTLLGSLLSGGISDVKTIDNQIFAIEKKISYLSSLTKKADEVASAGGTKAPTQKALVDFLGGNKEADAAAKALVERQKSFIAGLEKEATTLGMTSVQQKLYEAGILKITGAQLSGVKANAERIENYKQEQDVLEAMRNSYADAADSYLKFIQATQADVKSATDKVDRLKVELGLMDKTEAARTKALSLYDLEIKYEERLKELRGQNVSENIFNIEKESLEKVKSHEQEVIRLQEFLDTQKKAAAETQKIWDNFGFNFQRNIGDQIYNGLNGNFKDISSAWKSMLTRMLADAAAAQLSSALFGKDGSGGMLGAGMKIFSSLLGLGSLGAGGGAGAGQLRVSTGGLTGLAANGAYFDGNVAKFALGGIVNSPTPFKFADGGSFRSGLMGEAGPEAIMPLKRDSAGRLGVSGGGGGVTVNDNRVIHIDSRSDRASIMQDIQRANKQSNAELVDLLSRQGKI